MATVLTSDSADAPMPAHVLLVEDDASLAAWIADYLVLHGLVVTVASRGDTALEMIERDVPDAVVLDLGLPVIDGIAVCRRARAFYARPILMLTARDEDDDEIRGLDSGADDYLAKPVRPRVLLARLRALLRREQSTGSERLMVGALELDISSRSVQLDGQGVALSTQEFDLLEILATQVGQPVDRQTLITRLRGIDYDAFDRSVDLAISRLRKKLGDNGSAPRRIKTVRGRGYQLVPDAW